MFAAGVGFDQIVGGFGRIGAQEVANEQERAGFRDTCGFFPEGDWVVDVM